MAAYEPPWPMLLAAAEEEAEAARLAAAGAVKEESGEEERGEHFVLLGRECKLLLPPAHPIRGATLLFVLVRG